MSGAGGGSGDPKPTEFDADAVTCNTAYDWTDGLAFSLSWNQDQVLEHGKRYLVLFRRPSGGWESYSGHGCHRS